MSASVKQKKIDELLEKAAAALKRKTWFEAERIAVKAMMMARQEQDFDRMAQCVPPLLEARQERMQQAMTGNKINIVDTAITEDMKIKRGCYLIQPPLVGLDARRLRLAALNNDIPVAVLCREPLTQAKLTPVVAISPNITIRVKVATPPKPAAPSMAWFASSMREMGDWAIESLDETLPIIRKIDQLLDFLDALPEHENLHHALEASCRQAHECNAKEKSAGKSKLKP